MLSKAMAAIDDPVSETNPSNPDLFVDGDDHEWWNKTIADSYENHHVPLASKQPLHNLEETSTSPPILDHGWSFCSNMQWPASNYTSSDCWSNVSEALSQYSWSDASEAPSQSYWSDASEAMSLDCWPPDSQDLIPSAFKVAATEDGKWMDVLMTNHVSELDNLEMDNSTNHVSGFDIDVLSLESDEEDVVPSASNRDEIQSDSTVNLKEETHKVNSQVPGLGMVFSSEEEAYKFYNTYAKDIGFRIRKGKVQRLSNGTIRKRNFVCSKEGFRLKKESTKTSKYQRKETRTGCDAMIQLKFENGKWVIYRFTPEHNHALEGKSKILAGSSTNTAENHSLSATVNKVGIMKEAVDADSVGFHNIGCTSLSRPRLVNGKSLINYFKNLQVEDPSFSYSVQVNDQNCLTHFVWTDGRSKIDYDYFGDVLILDTTFRIDACDMICAQFSGINHHGQCVLLGGAFLLDDSVDSFIWMLRTFLQAVGERQPKTIFTDVCQAVSDAIEVVLPETQHLLGVWYILQNTRKHLSTCYGQHGFDSLFNKCIFDCESEGQFESMWESLLEQYDLRENSWLKTLYLLRRKWSHFSCKGIFSAGIRSKQSCESITSVFHNLTSQDMTTLQFVEEYLKVSEQQHKEELYEDFRCNESTPATILRSSAIEKEAARIYTCTMFKLFQEELLGCLSVAIEEIPSNGMVTTFKLTEEGHTEKIVEFHCLELHVMCSCKKYESVGILCVHVLKVLNARNIFHIPPQYILKRWTKSAKDGMVVDGEGEVAEGSQRHFCRSKSKLMHKALNVITKSLAVEETWMIVEDSLNITLKKVEDVLKTKCTGDLDVHCKDDDAAAAAADAHDVGGSMETPQSISSLSKIHPQQVSNQNMKSQLKRKSSDDAFTHPSLKEIKQGGNDQGSGRGVSHSYCVGENSRQSSPISSRPPLSAQFTFHKFKDPTKITGTFQKHLDDLKAHAARLRNDNLQIRTRTQMATQSYLNREAENSVLRAQITELRCRLLSLKEIISFMDASNDMGIKRSIITEPVMDSYLNQPMIMAAADIFQY